MSEIKYTSDGKKVAIIGKLNSNETIVQEIFVTKDGAEIPSGENFIVKSLHDNPVISWQEKKTQEYNKLYEESRKTYENYNLTTKQQLQKEQKLLAEKLRYIKSVIDNVCIESFDMVKKVLLGEYKYYIDSDYNPEIKDIETFRCSYDDKKFKLLSLFGSDDGTLNFYLNNYSDGSGYYQCVYFFETEEEAIQKLIELIQNHKYINEHNIMLSKKYNFQLDKELLNKYYKTQKDQINTDIAKSKNYIKELQEKLKKIQSEE